MCAAERVGFSQPELEFSTTVGLARKEKKLESNRTRASFRVFRSCDRRGLSARQVLGPQPLVVWIEEGRFRGFQTEWHNSANAKPRNQARTERWRCGGCLEACGFRLLQRCEKELRLPSFGNARRKAETRPNIGRVAVLRFAVCDLAALALESPNTFPRIFLGTSTGRAGVRSLRVPFIFFSSCWSPYVKGPSPVLSRCGMRRNERLRATQRFGQMLASRRPG